MLRLALTLLLTFSLTACGVLRAPVSLVEDRLQRNDDVFHRYGIDLDRIAIGDRRQTVHDLWGAPRNTLPSYRDFDVYLGIRNSEGEWRVLPGDYNELKRTNPLIVQVSYVDDHVNAIFLFGQDAYGNSRAWCDDTRHCAELFPYHVAVDVPPPVNPLLVTAREPGFALPAAPAAQQCDLVVFAAAGDKAWDRRLNFLELLVGNTRKGFLAPGTYHVSRHAPGSLSLSVWPNFDYKGTLSRQARDSWDNELAVDCDAGERHFVEVVPAEGGLFTLDPGLRLSVHDEASALSALAVKRAIVTSSPRVPATAPRLQGTARLSR